MNESQSVIEAIKVTKEEFTPFEKTFICPECNRPLQLYVQKVHLQMPVNCPRCSRSLSALIRKTIKTEHVSS